MMQFNYLGESVPSLIDRVRATRVSAELQAPLLALVTATLVVTAWWILEGHWYARSQQEFQRAQARLVSARALRSVAKIQRSGVEHLLVLDQQLRSVRSSGSTLGVRIVDVANRIPERVWLTSLAPVPGGIDINGRAVGIVRLGETIGRLGATLVRATREERADSQALVAFELHVDE
jgi:Tfp pilus assembly protein PilN